MENEMRRYKSSFNTIFDYGLPFQLLVQKRWSGSTVAIFDTNTLLTNIFAEPGRYLEARRLTRRVSTTCGILKRELVDTPSMLPLNSFIWYHPVHPSERTRK
ncbi:hypothetical protein BGZ61DRAFT_375359 [Ilyonectria robusta]|uniref:uncharacterized protein n=1 Tax=Ilyonectria robusta TaxID=1079257 RepID=UPI001E8D8FB7|nr:uncharacterized protein BGZ61DRAFT_375359 [Ilyonectria robusta]KAH8651473.1 hypothetical protein BGZ61DRAFT_375359 [Ilyonectria robusta]